MIVSIGILAWNEVASIGTTLRSLFAQSLPEFLRGRGDRLEIHCVPNGCTDRTAQVAETILAECARPYPRDFLVWGVHNLKTPGKGNAWNVYVHEIAAATAEFLFLVDADIRLLERDTLRNMLVALETRPGAAIATDLPVKHVAFKARKSLFDRISLAVGRITQALPGQVTGQLYCARGALLRRFRIPEGILAEDGFIKQIVASDFYTRPVDNARIVRAPGASHVFESYTRLRDIFNHQRRQEASHTLYRWLHEYLKTRIGERDPGEFTCTMGEQHPEWFLEVVRERVRGGGWLIYPGALTVHFRRLRQLPPWKALVYLPVSIMRSIGNVFVLVSANRWLKSGKLKGLWKGTKSSTLAAVPLPPK